LAEDVSANDLWAWRESWKYVTPFLAFPPQSAASCTPPARKLLYLAILNAVPA
jgi:hypothetical protein